MSHRKVTHWVEGNVSLLFAVQSLRHLGARSVGVGFNLGGGVEGRLWCVGATGHSKPGRTQALGNTAIASTSTLLPNV